MRFRTRSDAARYSANARWRAAEARAEAERAAGIPDRPAPVDLRQPITLDLSTYGGPRLRIEPRPGRISVRVIDADLPKGAGRTDSRAPAWRLTP